MGKVKLFPSPEYTSKQPKDPVVPKLPMTGILLGPSKSGKSTALVVQPQHRRRLAPRQEVHRGDHEGAGGPGADLLRGVGRAGTAPKQMKLRSFYQILIVIDDFADNPHLHKRSGDSALDTLFVRGRHFQISTLVSTQKLRLVSNAVRVNSQFFCIWRLRNQLEKDSLLEELTALVPKARLEAMYEAAVAEPYSFLYIYPLNPLEKMFHIRFERVLNNDGAAAGDGFQQAARQQHAVPERVPEH